MSSHPRSARVVLATFGTHGDLHPFMALALALRRRGVHPVIAAAAFYRAKIEAEGLEFAPMRPELDVVAARLQMEQHEIARAAAERPEFIVRDILMPHLRETYEDALQATRDAALVVTHSAAYGARLAAEKRGLPHISIALQPMILMSAHDPPVIANLPQLSRAVYASGLAATRAFIGLGRLVARRWARPIEVLRREIGLPISRTHPLFDAQFAGERLIAMFSPLFGPPQPDHPPHTSIVGFAFYDSEAAGPPRLSMELNAFLARGPAPLVFTQGTSAVQDAEHFIRESLAAITLIKQRAVLVLDAERVAQWRTHASGDVLITGYAPYSLLFPRAAVNVHHGGVGTTAQALRAARPQLIAPYLVDQPDNAARVARLGAGRSLRLTDYRADRIASELSLLQAGNYAARAATIGTQISHEDGASAAADIIVNTLARADRHSTSAS